MSISPNIQTMENIYNRKILIRNVMKRMSNPIGKLTINREYYYTQVYIVCEYFFSIIQFVQEIWFMMFNKCAQEKISTMNANCN